MLWNFQFQFHFLKVGEGLELLVPVPQGGGTLRMLDKGVNSLWSLDIKYVDCKK